MKKLFLSIACIGAMMVSLLVGTAVWAAPTSQEQDVTAPVTPPEGTVFAGWFYDDTFETPYREATGTATAKFVDKSILSVKYQLTTGANDGQEYTKLRVITTVDSLKYQSVGFKIEYDGNVLDRSTTTVYRTLTGTDGVTSFNYTPAVFSPDSAYFCAYNVKVMAISMSRVQTTADGHGRKPFRIFIFLRRIHP